MQGILPVLGGLMLYFILGWSLYFYWKPVNSYTSWQMQFPPHWDIGGVFLIDIACVALGIVLMFFYASLRPPFFRGEVLTRSTPTLVPEDVGFEVGLFGVDPDEVGVSSAQTLEERMAQMDGGPGSTGQGNPAPTTTEKDD